VALPDASIFWLVFFAWMTDDDFNFNGAGIAVAIAMIVAAVAIVAIVAVAAPTIMAAGVGVAVLTRASFAGILAAVGSAARADDGGDECSCEWEAKDRRGGISFYTQIHNACADLFTDIPNQDIKLRGVYFDGIRQAEFPPRGTLYEIKTGLFYSTIKALRLTRPKLQGFLDALKLKAVAGFYRERIPAGLCQYGVGGRHAGVLPQHSSGG
jgi:hypothetical protein